MPIDIFFFQKQPVRPASKGLFHLHSRYIVGILVHSHFHLVSLLQEATELISEPVTQMAVSFQ